MLWPWLAHDPDSSPGFERCEIGDHFAKMIVIAPVQLIFYDDDLPILVLGDQIGISWEPTKRATDRTLVRL